ncbi:MAG: hypothetical protein IT355_19175 [Gemmatimonadaceae bacterium]|nr:hypothetical protein [Gemmatimonadaceae bacterium]
MSLLLLALAATPCGGQRVGPVVPRPSRLQPTLRADLLAGTDPAVQLAAGLQVSAAYNVRIAVESGVGAVSRPEGWRRSGRVDLLLRWLADPFRASRHGLNAGGGLGLLVEDGRAPRPVAILTVGMDGSGTGHWLKGVELGLGGGVRAGLTLRRAPGRRR